MNLFIFLGLSATLVHYLKCGAPIFNGNNNAKEKQEGRHLIPIDLLLIMHACKIQEKRVLN